MNIPPLRLDLQHTNRILTDIEKVLNSGYLSQSTWCSTFEQELQEYLHSGTVVTTNSGSAALELMIRTLGIRNQDILCPVNTFFATVEAIIRSGNTPVFVDCDKYLQMDFTDAKKRRTKKTAAIMLVHIGGFITQDIDKFVELCAQERLMLLEDISHSIGTTYNQKHTGTFGHAAAGSLYATKVLTSGEGGVALFKNSEEAKKAKLLRDQGRVPGTTKHTVHGFNYRMHEIEAIIAHHQLRELAITLKKRRSIANQFLKNIKGNFLIPQVGQEPNFYKLICFTNKARQVKEFCKTQGIHLPGEVYDIPCNEQPVFDTGDRTFLNAQQLCKEHICLPIYPSLTQDEVDYIIQVVNKAL
ncbi:DegT/DnrJ/EryC1/StrS family aminotransferase [Candidatus Woesearchaeota archaeon]|nr:DegT/DnrJ/EryC1/StrS family aminotransferase [Candidatus Woesearchaeota archaeon]